MLGRNYKSQNCSAARALEIVGERWSLLIIRDALFRGMTRFSDFQRSLGIAPNVLTTRLEHFVAHDIMEIRRYSERPEQHEYILTAKGLDFQPVIVALTAWGDHWDAPDGPPITFHHKGCTGSVELGLQCVICGAIHLPGNVEARPGPGNRGSE